MARTSNTRLTLLAASLLAAFAGQSLAAPAINGQDQAIARLKAATGNAADVAIHPATGAARFVRLAPNGSAASVRAAGAATDVAKQAGAQQFLGEYGALFGITNPSTELAAGRLFKDRLGHTRLVQPQVYKGVPVFGGELRSHFDATGNLSAVNGTFVPGISLDVVPKRDARQAAARALARVQEDVGQGVKLATSQPVLVVYREGLVRGVEGANRLAWQVTVGNGSSVREFVFVDAHNGRVIDQFTGTHDSKNRRAFDGAAAADAPGPNYPATPLWVEGQPLPTGNTEADNMIFASGEVHDFFKRAFGRDSFDGNGATMDSIFNRGWGCVNASWNGTYISFCPGTTTDDVTAHEWGHAYTEYTHGLIYAWQSGALNEAYSDIWGETIDRINGRDGSGGTANSLRTAGSCTLSTPLPPTVKVNSPGTLFSPDAAGGASFGPQSFSLTNNVVLAEPLNGCTALTNGSSVAGKIVFIDRGTCTFQAKAEIAFAAGAVGVIIGNNQGGTAATGMSGTGANLPPTVMVSQNDGAQFKAALAAGAVNVSLLRGGTGTDNSVRWLMGEDSSAFGGAIRDMYNPGCYSQPAKVTGAGYVCAAAANSNTDQGGVHTNSGVPNHAYALLVDGGDYNGQSIAAIGLTKAAHIYWRAQSVYQMPTTDFPAHADALEQSCRDLKGVNLTSLTTGTASGESIADADCAQVAKAMLAVEMRTPPVQCNFKPLLAKSPPALCAAGTPSSLISDSFDGGRRAGVAWKVTNEGATGYTPRNWGVTNVIPAGRSGYAMFGMDPNTSCNADETAVMHLDSPEFTVPATASNLRMSFDHWIASESGWDGGNLKISVNGGAWQVVQSADFVYNPYNMTLATAGAGNTNPMAGQPAFSGTDAGSNAGSWGRSIINLAPYAAAGAKVKLRFDMGVDYCSGVRGWYVDDVNVYTCKP